MSARVRQASRACPGCGKALTPLTYACRTCWYTLPTAMRSAINQAWAGVLRGDVDAADDHADAKAEADAFLKARAGQS